MLKKFITTAARQKVLGSPGFYTAVDNPELQYEIENSFPILAMINAYVEEGDEVELIVVRMVPADELGRATALENAEAMEAQADALCTAKKSVFRGRTDFPVPDDEQLDTHLDIFSRLISQIGADDHVYVDITYGTKTQTLAIYMAINYIGQATDVELECVVYGNFNFQTKEKRKMDTSIDLAPVRIIRKKVLKYP